MYFRHTCHGDDLIGVIPRIRTVALKHDPADGNDPFEVRVCCMALLGVRNSERTCTGELLHKCPQELLRQPSWSGVSIDIAPWSRAPLT